ncbi:hypothetical protein KC336_g21360, partial [Hortaea werneckii]
HFDTQDVSAEETFADADATKLGQPYGYNQYEHHDSQAYESQPEQQRHQSQPEDVYGGGGDHASQSYATNTHTQDVFGGGGDNEHEYGQVFPGNGAGIHDHQQAFGGAAGLEEMKQEEEDALAALADASYFAPAAAATAAAAAPRSNYSQ